MQPDRIPSFRLPWLGWCLIVIMAAIGAPMKMEQGAPFRMESRQPPKRALPRPFDQPSRAIDYQRSKRLPAESTEVPVDRYLRAGRRIGAMQRFSTTGQQTETPSPWTYLGPGNIGGRTRALVINPQTPQIMLAGGVAGGVWKTVNGGQSWFALDDQMPNLAVSTLAMDPDNPNIIYAGTGEGFSNGDAVRGLGIFKTTDGGLTWQHLEATNSPDFHYVNDLVISPRHGNHIYAGTREGVFRSADGGMQWTRILAPLQNAGCLDLDLAADGSTDVLLAACGNFEQSAVYRNAAAHSTDSWQQVLTEPHMGRTALAIAPSDQNIVYALSAKNDPESQFYQGLEAVFRSDDNGITWSALVRQSDPDSGNRLLLTNASYHECLATTYSQGWYDNVIAVDPTDPERVWAGGVDLFRSDNGGRDWGLASLWWVDETESEYVHADQHRLLFHPHYDGVTNNTLFVSNDGGVFATRDANAPTATIDFGNLCSDENQIGVVWESLSHGYGVTQFYHGTPFPDGRSFIGGTQDNGTIMGTQTAGPDHWSRLLTGDGGYTAINPHNTDEIYASFTRLSIVRSNNGGDSFVDSSEGIEDEGALFIAPFVMDPNRPQTLWAGGSYPWRTDNGGLFWTRAGTAFPANASASAIAVSPHDSDVVVMGTHTGRILRTGQGSLAGEDEIWLESRPRDGFVSSLCFDPFDDRILYATYATFGGVHVWRSLDGGDTWSPSDGQGKNGMLPDLPVHNLVVHPLDSSRLYIGTDLGVFVSLNTGTSWSVENTGFANVVTETLSTVVNGCDVTLFAFTHGRGAWKAPLRSTFSLIDHPVDALGDSIDLDLSLSGDCDWVVLGQPNWLHPDITAGSGSQTITVTADPNPGHQSRQATLNIAGETVTFVQAGRPCDIDFQPDFVQVFGQGSSGSASADTAVDCSWEAISDSSWLQVTGNGAGTGTQTINYFVEPLASGFRTGRISIGDHYFTVSQTACRLSSQLRNALLQWPHNQNVATLLTIPACQ